MAIGDGILPRTIRSVFVMAQEEVAAVLVAGQSPLSMS